jgi:hypothetical protein
MKKLMVSVIAALFAVALVIPAYAGDMLDLSGEFRVRGWDKTNIGSVDGADQSYFDQRMRIAAKINVSDNAHVMIRTDLGEGAWGQNFSDLSGGAARPIPGTSNSVDFDRLYMFLDQDMWELTLGQQYGGLGILEVLDANFTGANLRLKFGAFQPSFIYGKVDEAGSLNDDGVNDDTNLYAVNFSFLMGENFDSNVFGAMVDDKSTNGENLWALGFHTAGKMGNLGLTGEVAHFGGDDGSGIDYNGTQFYLKAESAITEMFTLGGELLYAFGEDDPNEAQVTNLVNWWSFTPMSNNTPNSADFSAFGGNPFDPSGDGAGTQTVTVFAQMNASDALSMGTKLAYFQPEEDDATLMDNGIAANAWVAYKLTGNATASLTYLRVMPDYDSTVINDEDVGTFIAKLAINF